MEPATTQRLKEGAAALGVSLDDDQVARLDRYQQLLSTWNTRINLTAITEPDEVVDRHFIDSLAVVPFLGDRSTLVDVGAGAGFPGGVIAIVRPKLRVTAVESIQKKVAFLQALRREIAPNLEPVCARVEKVERQFDIAVSRATFDPAEWVRIGSRLVAPGGLLIAMQGAEQPDLTSPSGFDPPQVHSYALASGRRRLVLFHRST